MPGIFDSGIFDSGIFDEASGSFARNAADSLSTLTESPVRVATYTRTASDSLSSITESASRVRTVGRTVADSLSSLTEAVVGVLKHLVSAAVGAAGKLSTSTDDTLWTARTLGIGGAVVNDVAYGNGLWIAVGNSNHMVSSTDGVTWGSVATTSFGGSDNLFGITYGNALWVATGSTAASANKIATSPDGTTWTQLSSLPFGSGSTGQIDRVTYGGDGYFVLVGGGKFGTSPDGSTWTSQTTGFGSSQTFDAAYGNGRWVICGGVIGGAAQLQYSDDHGVNWTTATSVPVLSSAVMEGVAYGNGTWVAVALNAASGQQIVTSTDGDTWSAQTIDFGRTGLAITYDTANSLFICVGDSGGLATSPDGVAWTAHTSAFGSTTILSVRSRPSPVQVRAISDALSAISESVVAYRNLASRTISDSISSITEAVVASVSGAIVRTVSDSVATLTEAVTQTKIFNRTVADSISSITATVARVGTVARNLADVIAGIFETVSNSGAPTNPPSPPAPATFDLTVAGTSILFEPVMYEKAHFESQVNGVAGSCTFRVRDDERTHSFIEGQPIVLTINSQTAWRGFITAIKRVYAFDAINVSQFGLARFFDIEGADINTLLTKRIVFDQSDGAHIEAPLLPPYTPDLTAIQELFADWLDLSGDGLDTTTLVQNVADTVWSQEARAWEGSDTWAQAMQSIANLPAAIYYINPDKKFVYTDVDTANAPFELSDQPDGVTSFGYSQMEVLKDGSSLANDVMCWGIGYGSQTPVFVRVEDATSQAAHGVWQLGQTTFGVYKQDTITRIADSIVYGSPQSKRGAKDDRVSVQCVTYQNGLRAGDKVDFTSNVFGFNDVLPIRKLEIDFPTPFQPKYTLTLSHEIDTPFSFFDNYWFDYNFPPFALPRFRLPVLPSLSGCVCGITDDFNRTSVATLGTSSSSLVWGYSGTQSQWSVSAGTATLALPGGSPVTNSAFLSLTSQPVVTSDITASGRITTGDSSNANYWLLVGATLTDSAELDFCTDGTLVLFTGSGTDFVTMPFAPSSAFKVRLQAAGTNARAKCWLASDPEPSSWTLTAAFTASTTEFTSTVSIGGVRNSGSNPLTAQFAALDAEGVDSCLSVQFDDFNRSVSAGAGTATPSGLVWSNVTTPGGSDYGVNGSHLFCGLSGGTFRVRTATGVGPWAAAADTLTFVTRFYFHQDSGVFANFETFRMELRDAGGDSIGWVFQINGSGGGFTLYSSPSGGTTNYTLPSGWSTIDYSTIAVYFLVKWQLTLSTGDVQAKVWLETDGEPASWQVVAPFGFTNPLDPSTARFNIELASSFANRAGYVDYVDYDYTGRPCYLEDCPDRLNFPMEVLAKVRVGGTPDGNSTNLNFAFSESSSLGSAEVNGRLGLESVQVGVSPIDERMFLTGKGTHGGTSFGGVNDGTINNVVGSWLWVRLRLDANTGVMGRFWADGSGEPSTWTVASGAYARPGGLIRTLAINATLGTTYWEIAEITVTGYNGDTLVETFNRTVGSGWGTSEFSALPPAYQDWTADSGALSVTPGLAKIGPGSSSVYLEFPTCDDVPVDPGAGVPANAWVCEQFDGAAALLTLGHPFLPNSPQVWVDGLLQPQSAYTQDAAAGTITLDSPPGPSGTARVCYWSYA